MRRWAFLLFVVVAACGGGGASPEVTSLTVSRPDLRRGTEFFATAHVKDADGDLSRAKVTVVMESIEGSTALETSVVASDVAPGATEADVIVGLTILGAIDLGPYDLVLFVEDQAGNRSDEAVITVDVEQ